RGSNQARAERAALDLVTEAVLIVDAAGEVRFASAALERLIGNTELARDYAREALTRGEPLALRRIRVGGSEQAEPRLCEATAVPVRDGEQLLGAVALVRDVTGELGRAAELERADREL